MGGARSAAQLQGINLCACALLDSVLLVTEQEVIEVKIFGYGMNN